MTEKLFPKLLCFLPLLILCSDNGSPSAPGDEQIDSHSPAGTWEATIARDTTLNIQHDLKITMRYVQETKNYFIDVVEEGGGKVLFESLGDWDLSEDSVVLTGSSCSRLDTTSNTLEPIPDSICGSPVAIRAPTSETEWYLPLSSLGQALLNAFGIPEDLRNLTVIISLTFTRVGATAAIPESGAEEGDWSVSLPADTLGNTIQTNLVLSPNQSFAISFEHSEYAGMIFTQTGTYTTNDNGSVTFHPEACSGIDSASGELVPLADSLCTTGFTVPGPDSESQWRISGADLGPLLDQLPLTEQEKGILQYLSLSFAKDTEQAA